MSLQLVIGAADTVSLYNLTSNIKASTNNILKSRISTWAFLEAMMTFPDVQEKAQQEIGQ